MADNFDFRKFLVENKLGPYSKVKFLNEGEVQDFNQWLKQVSEYTRPGKDIANLGVDIDTVTPDEFTKAVIEKGGKRRGYISDAMFGDTIHVTYKEDNVRRPHIGFSYSLESFGTWYPDEGRGRVMDRNIDPRDTIYPPGSRMDENTPVRQVTEAAMRLQPGSYYEVEDLGTGEWNEYKYVGEVDGGSTVGEVGEHMFMAPTGPGAFIFVTVSDGDLASLVRPSQEDIMNEASNPNREGDALVMGYIKDAAKKFEYGIRDAATFIKETIKRLGY